jgi:hypothetical protein
MVGNASRQYPFGKLFPAGPRSDGHPDGHLGRQHRGNLEDRRRLQDAELIGEAPGVAAPGTWVTAQGKHHDIPGPNDFPVEHLRHGDGFNSGRLAAVELYDDALKFLQVSHGFRPTQYARIDKREETPCAI